MPRFAVSTLFFHEYPCDHIFDYIAESGLDDAQHTSHRYQQDQA